MHKQQKIASDALPDDIVAMMIKFLSAYELVAVVTISRRCCVVVNECLVERREEHAELECILDAQINQRVNKFYKNERVVDILYRGTESDAHRRYPTELLGIWHRIVFAPTQDLLQRYKDANGHPALHTSYDPNYISFRHTHDDTMLRVTASEGGIPKKYNSVMFEANTASDESMPYECIEGMYAAMKPLSLQASCGLLVAGLWCPLSPPQKMVGDSKMRMMLDHNGEMPHGSWQQHVLAVRGGPCLVTLGWY